MKKGNMNRNLVVCTSSGYVFFIYLGLLRNNSLFIGCSMACVAYEFTRSISISKKKKKKKKKGHNWSITVWKSVLGIL